MIYYKIDVIHALKDKGLNTYAILKDGIFSQGVMTSFRRGDPPSAAVLDRLCRILGRQPGSIIGWRADGEETN